jgi:hypothetical protein
MTSEELPGERGWVGGKALSFADQCRVYFRQEIA